jgi:CRP-like cAMP-binding protein
MLGFLARRDCRNDDKKQDLWLMIDPSSRVDVMSLLRRSDVFSVLSDDALDRLAASGRVERFDARVLLNAAGTPLTWLRLVVLGHIEIVASRKTGEEVALASIGRGGWVTWAGCFADQPPDYDFYSSGDACFVALSSARVREIAEQHTVLYRRIIQEMGVRLRQLMEWTAESVLLNPEQRMAKLIHLLARTHGIGTNSGILPVTQARLASLAGCSRQSANALLKALEQRGLIQIAYGRYKIQDMVRLEVFIESAHEGS